MSSVTRTWQRLEQWFAENLPAALTDLNPGCDEDAFRIVEERMGIVLPETLKEVYRLHNGQKPPERSIVGIFYGVYFLSLSQMVDQWQVWVDSNVLIDEAEHRDELDEFQVSFAPTRLKPLYSNNKWIPFAIIAENCYLGMDFDPAPEGV